MRAISEQLRGSSLHDLHGKVLHGRRRNFDDGMRLCATADLTGVGYLANLARELRLDNLPNIQSSWRTQGPELGQIGLQCGVQDMGSTILEENVVSKESVCMVPLPEIERLITDAGFTPARRNAKYELLPAA